MNQCITRARRATISMLYLFPSFDVLVVVITLKSVLVHYWYNSFLRTKYVFSPEKKIKPKLENAVLKGCYCCVLTAPWQAYQQEGRAKSIE